MAPKLDNFIYLWHCARIRWIWKIAILPILKGPFRFESLYVFLHIQMNSTHLRYLLETEKSCFSVLLQIRKKLYVLFSTFESGAFIWSGYLLLSSSEWRWTCEPYLFLHYYSPRKPLVFQGFESLSFPASYYFYKLQTQKLVELYQIKYWKYGLDING